MFSVKFAPRGKDPNYANKLAREWEAKPGSLDDLLTHANIQGFPWCPGIFDGGYRSTKRFKSTAWVVLDLDGIEGRGMTESEYAQEIKRAIRLGACAVMQSASSKPGARKARVLFRLSKAITNADLYSAIARYLAEQFPHADLQVIDAARFFYGAPGQPIDYRNLEAMLDLDSLRTQVEATLEPAKAKPTPRVTTSNGSRVERYVQTAINLELAALENVPKGRGNRALYDGALKIYSLLKAGPFGESEATAAMMNSEVARRRPQSEATATLRSALEKANARELPQKSAQSEHIKQLGNFYPVSDRLQDEQNFVHREPADELPRHFAKGVPPALISAILGLRRGGWQADHTAAALAYVTVHELILSGGMKPGACFGVAELVSSHRALTPATALKGLRQLEGAGFVAATEKCTTEAGGKPRQLYQLLPLPEALRVFRAKRALVYRQQEFGNHTPDTITPRFFDGLDLDDARELADIQNILRQPLYEEHAARIATANTLIQTDLEREERAFQKPGIQFPPGAWPSGQIFRRAFYLELVKYEEKHGRSKARHLVAKDLGIRPESLTPIRRAAGVVTEAQYREIPYSEGALEKTPESPIHELVTSGGKSQPTRAGRENNKRFASQAMARGESVSIRVRLASRQRIATDAEREALAQDAERRKQLDKEARAARAERRKKALKARPYLEDEKVRYEGALAAALERTAKQKPPEVLEDYHSPHYIAVQLAMTPKAGVSSNTALKGSFSKGGSLANPPRKGSEHSAFPNNALAVHRKSMQTSPQNGVKE